MKALLSYGSKYFSLNLNVCNNIINKNKAGEIFSGGRPLYYYTPGLGSVGNGLDYTI